MTVERLSPFVYSEGDKYRFTLESDLSLRVKGHQFGQHVFRDCDGQEWLRLDGEVLTVRKKYSWDGASPKFKLGPFWLGTPDFEGTRLGTLVHDVLYQFLHVSCFPLKRNECDRLFGEIMRSEGCGWWWTYSRVVLVFGGVHNGIGTIFAGKKDGNCLLANSIHGRAI